jgi:SAM-dependent methyltransferase
MRELSRDPSPRFATSAHDLFIPHPSSFILSMTSESYGAFAWAYDAALGQKFFQAVRRMLDDVMEKHPSLLRTHLDVACGTGYAVEYFERRGFRSVGVDASLPMLSIARQRARALVTADFRSLPLRGQFGRITCLYDSLNHMQTERDLVAAFSAVAEAMGPQSLFLFDMNHPDIYPAVWGMREPFVSSGDDHHLEIATKFRRREKRAYARVTGWSRLADGTVVKIRESHEQRAWSEREIAACLEEASLQIVELLDFDPFQEMGLVDAAGVKLFYVCRLR